MLTLPDLKEKKIIYVLAEKDIESQIKFWNSNIRLYRNGEFVNQISCYMVLSIYIIGNVTITSSLIDKAKKYGISIFLLNRSFKQYAEIMSAAEGNYRIRSVQYTMPAERELAFAKAVVQNKVKNQIAVMEQHKKTTKKTLLTLVNKQIDKAETIYDLLGIEGNMANAYFTTIFQQHGWNRRAPQTKEDITNFLMDIGYTYLFNLVDSLLRLFGFDTYKGFYHQLFFQRKSLSCDIMEPMRYLVDKQIAKAYALGQIQEKDFTYKNGSYMFKPGSEIRSKYSLLFFRLLMKHKAAIYTYIRTYYLHVLNPDKYQFPEFEVYPL